MSFVNISKVILENKEDIKKAHSDVMLVMASIVHEQIQEDDFEGALGNIDLLKQATCNLEKILKRY